MPTQQQKAIASTATISSTTGPQKIMARCLLVVLATTLCINLLSAYIRHVEAGIGCTPWPQCYGVIGNLVQPADSADVARRALAPTQVAKQVHRTIAIVLVIAVLLLLHQCRQPNAMNGLNRALPYVLLAVLLLLSVVGPASYLKTRPAIAVVNMIGGLALLGISWWLWLQLSPLQPTTPSAKLKRLARTGWILLMVQIALGTWVSANFAGLSCTELFNCDTATNYLTSNSSSFWYFRELSLDKSGRVLFDNTGVVIHLVHRVGAVLAGLCLLTAALTCLSELRVSELRAVSGQRLLCATNITAIAIIVLVALQWLLGIAGVVFSLPLLVVMGHNLSAALLLLAVMTLNYLLH